MSSKASFAESSSISIGGRDPPPREVHCGFPIRAEMVTHCILRICPEQRLIRMGSLRNCLRMGTTDPNPHVASPNVIESLDELPVRLIDRQHVP